MIFLGVMQGLSTKFRHKSSWTYARKYFVVEAKPLIYSKTKNGKSLLCLLCIFTKLTHVRFLLSVYLSIHPHVLFRKPLDGTFQFPTINNTITDAEFGSSAS
jgi:hypothetical protein